MKLIATLAICLATLCAPAAVSAQASAHGGVVMQAGGLELELVATKSLLRLYVRGASPPPDLAKSRARVTLRNGTDQQVVELLPAGDRLEATGAFVVAPGTEAVATLATTGVAPVTARFVMAP